MGSLESPISLKRAGSRNERNPFLSRTRSRFSRFLLFNKLDYIQWICTVVVFLFFVVFFQMFLPGSVMDKSPDSLDDKDLVFRELGHLKEMGGLDFGEDITLEPCKLLQKFQSQNKQLNLESSSALNRSQHRFQYRKPQLALVFADLLVDPQQLLMVTIANALREIGYEIQVYSIEDGPAYNVWQNMGVPVTVLKFNPSGIGVDWLNYDGILVSSLEAKSVFSSFMQEPFKSLPLIWTIHERALAVRSRQYTSAGQIELVNDWKNVFNRATVVVFPNYALPMIYSTFDTGNYYVIPGSPADAWKGENAMYLYKDNQRASMGYGPNEVLIAIIGSQFMYRGLWLEHALILQALLPLFADFSSDNDSISHPKIIVLSSDSASNYSMAVEKIALNLRYPRGVVKHVAVHGDVDGILSMTDLVIYGSFLEEPSFPEILIKAMSHGKPIVAPDLSNIRKYVDNRVNGYLFPKENISVLTQIILQMISKGKLSQLALNIASIGRGTVKNVMVQETIEGYAMLLENVLKFPSEVAPPKAVIELPSKLREEWQWNLFVNLQNSTLEDKSSKFLNNLEGQWNHSQRKKFGSPVAMNDSFSYEIWEEEKKMHIFDTKRRREEQELKDRTDQSRGTWEDVYRNAKRADRARNDLHERDERELERTGQPLCIYEPYFGEGTWPFLHRSSLYRGIGLSTKGRRPRMDDVDGPSRLELLKNSYYRDILGEYGAFFAIANRIDHLHRNAWIGFQSWRATARKASLSEVAETSLLGAIEKRKYGDALYFWVRMDKDPRNSLQQDFWSFCDAINAGNCKFAFSETLKTMYGIRTELNSLPPMPEDGGTWSVMQSWALPTKSFLEFVMFSRMFVDALDAQMYDEHHQSGHCYLSFSKDKHCYSRMLELLINVWAYHSARRMVYVNPESGVMQEYHIFKDRRGKMWVKWFALNSLKAMDEDLAGEADSDHSKRRWIWPSTGEVVWQGVLDRERNIRNRQKEKRKQKSKDKQERMRHKHRQKTLGKYVKPLPEEDMEISNSTLLTSN
ncbi:Chromosomal replication initiator DnaA [Gossypium australe]|uniref:Chromosomal replication initiator DnaA n=1 Tax=Gossypium australe TaxID=47621 RepID=A0A5B6W031_9ROSI|nr:Chromosomal replication initiator DnaA [Gossypium australe]